MFSSNQELKISGDSLEDLLMILEFGMTYSGLKERLTRRDKPTSLIFQITNTGKFCIGDCFKENIKEGWEFFPFDYDIEILARVILQTINKAKLNNEYCGGDGSSRKGFIMQHCESSNEEDIKNAWIGDLVFTPFYTYYAK